MSSKELLSCLIIGCGNIAGGFDSKRKSNDFPLTHAGAYTKHGGFKIVACVDPGLENRQAFMKRWSVDFGCQSLKVLRNYIKKIDVVSVCSPTSFHLKNIKEVLAFQPRVIFCEKPLASNLNHAEAIIDCCSKEKIPLIINYNRRWDTSVIRLQRELSAGMWGKIRVINGIYTRGVNNNGSHMIDLLQLLFGEIRLIDVGIPVCDGFDDDPSIPMVLQTLSGIPVFLSCGNAHDYSIFEMQIITELGVISMEDGGMKWRLRRVIASSIFHNYRVLDAGLKYQNGDLPKALMLAVDEVYRAAHGRYELSSTGNNALSSMRICEQAKKLMNEKIAPQKSENL